MFNECSNLTKLNFSFFNTENVENMNYAFAECISMIELNINNLKTSKVQSLNKMFYSCKNLKELYLPYLDTRKVSISGLSSVFDNCTSLNLFIDYEKCSNLINLIPEYINVTDI